MSAWLILYSIGFCLTWRDEYRHWQNVIVAVRINLFTQILTNVTLLNMYPLQTATLCREVMREKEKDGFFYKYLSGPIIFYCDV